VSVLLLRPSFLKIRAPEMLLLMRGDPQLLAGVRIVQLDVHGAIPVIDSEGPGQGEEGAAKQYLAQQVVGDLDLQVEGGRTNGEGEVSEKASSRSKRAIGGLHVQHRVGAESSAELFL
jgi:hypothetical protein